MRSCVVLNPTKDKYKKFKLTNTVECKLHGRTQGIIQVEGKTLSRTYLLVETPDGLLFEADIEDVKVLKEQYNEFSTRRKY
jgi:hypothetical protein